MLGQRDDIASSFVSREMGEIAGHQLQYCSLCRTNYKQSAGLTYFQPIVSMREIFSACMGLLLGQTGILPSQLPLQGARQTLSSQT